LVLLLLAEVALALATRQPQLLPALPALPALMPAPRLAASVALLGERTSVREAVTTTTLRKRPLLVEQDLVVVGLVVGLALEAVV
jgi:hypothetical protein